MKKTMTKIFALVLVLAMVIGFVAMIPTQANPNVEIAANNVIFEEKLHMMYAIKEESISTYENVVIELYDEKGNSLGSAIRDGRADIDSSEENEVWCAVFVAQEGIAVQDIAENVIAKVIADKQEVASGRRSVLEYLYSQLLTNSKITANQKAMYESLLAYAGALQTLLMNKPTNPVQCKDITNYSFVKVENGTIDGIYAAGMLDKTDANALAKLQANFLPAEGNEIKWNATVYSDANAAGTKYTNLTADEVAAHLAAGNHLILEAVEIGEDTPVIETAEATITFDDASKRTSFATTQQVWEENGITVTNDKASSTNNVADYINPVRFYKNSTVTVAHTNMTKVVFNCNSTTYANNLKDAIPGSTVDGKVVTVVLNEVKQEATYTMSSAAVWLDSIVVTYQVCQEHVNKTVSKDATCTEDGYTGRVICEVCGTVIEEGTVVTATGHNYEEKVTAPTCTAKGCTTYTCACGHTYTGDEVDALDHIDEDGDKLCDRDGCDYEFPGDDEPTTPAEPSVVATFEFGENGSASHADGSTKTSYTETNNGYTLSTTSVSNFYTAARDAKGNSCIKFGASSKTGSMTFTVPADVTKVVFYVSGYKAKTVTVTANGVSTAITTTSDTGEYTAIEIDTSVTKTVTFATTSTGYRAMLNTIEFYK